MFEKIATALSGVSLLEPRRFRDDRGEFVKTYHEGLFTGLGLDFEIKEEFFSTSARGVIRGMHFQVPPADHAKLVYCPVGAVLDVVLDIRRESPTFGQSTSFELSGANRTIALIPSGFAHGFLSLEEETVMVYKTSTVHAPACDAGIRWDSFGFSWAEGNPIVSAKDSALPTWAEFSTPF